MKPPTESRSPTGRSAAAGLAIHVPLWVVIGLGVIVMSFSAEPSANTSSRVAVGSIAFPEGVGSIDVAIDERLPEAGFADARSSDAPAGPSTPAVDAPAQRHGYVVVGRITPAPADPSGSVAPLDPAPTDEADVEAAVELDAIESLLELHEMPLPPETVRGDQVADFLARYFRVSRRDVGLYVRFAFESAARHRADPMLVLGVMATESSLNPNARSHVGAKGLMQVHLKVHVDKFERHGGVEMVWEPRVNIEVGTMILARMLKRTGSVEGALKHYVGAARLSSDGGYGAKVIAMRERLWAASMGLEVPRSPDGGIAARRANLAHQELQVAALEPTAAR